MDESRPTRRPRFRIDRWLAPTLITIAVLAGSGCVIPITLGQQQERERLSRLVYPAEAEYGPDLDIVVRRQGELVNFINRTARPYRDVRIWLNQQYVRELAEIDIGPNNDFLLSRWTNEYREGFPVATVLVPDAAAPIVSAELMDPATGLRHRLLAWPDDAEP
ncbi:MAG: hypothetical protein AAF333_02200 [Planctomycetota bacterium]